METYNRKILSLNYSTEFIKEMFRIYVINKVISKKVTSDDDDKSLQIKRCLCWILGVSLLFYFFTKKDIVEIPVDRQEIINQSKTGQETNLALSVNEESVNFEYDNFILITYYLYYLTESLHSL